MAPLIKIGLNGVALQQLRERYAANAGYFDLPHLPDSDYWRLYANYSTRPAVVFNITTERESFWRCYSIEQVFSELHLECIIFLNEVLGNVSIVSFDEWTSIDAAHDLMTTFVSYINLAFSANHPELALQWVRIVTDLNKTFQDCVSGSPTTATALNDGNLFLFFNDYVIKSGLNTATNPSTKILILMERYNCVTLSDLNKYAPGIMRAYLQNPNLPAIVRNCANYYFATKNEQADFWRTIENLEQLYPAGNACKIIAFLEYQKINVLSFISAFHEILVRKNGTVNCLMISGDHGVGKTGFLRPITNILIFAEIILGHFDDCSNKDLIYGEDVVFTSESAPKWTRLIEGHPLREDYSSNGQTSLIRRTPILMTIAPWTDFPETIALRQKCKSFEFKRPAEMFSRERTLCPGQTCVHDIPQFDISLEWRIYWILYRSLHEKCTIDCAHCNSTLCHFNTIKLNTLTGEEYVKCYQHGTIHSVKTTDPIPLRRSPRLSARTPEPSSLDPVEKCTHPHVHTDSIIHVQDWISFIGKWVRDFELTHTF